MAGAIFVGPEGLAEFKGGGVADDVGLPGNAAAIAVEGALGAKIDTARGRVGIDIGGDRLGNLDRLHAIEGGHFHGERTGGTRAGVVGIGASEGDAVHGDGRVFGTESTEADGADLAIVKIQFHAREMLEEFADVALGVVAKRVGGDGVRDVHGITLFHDGFGIALALGRDGERLELHGAIGSGRGLGGVLECADELEVFRGGGAGDDIDRGGDLAVTGVSDFERHAAGRDGGEAEETLVGRDGGIATLDDAHLGVAQILAGGGIEDLADDGAGGRLGEGRQRGEKRGDDEGEEGAEVIWVHGGQGKSVQIPNGKGKREGAEAANAARRTRRLQARHGTDVT